MKGIKFLAVFTLLLSLTALAGTWYLFHELQAERLAHEKLEGQYAQLEEKNDELKGMEIKFNQLQQEVDRLRVQVKGYVDQRDAAKKELETAYKEVAELNKQIKTLESEKSALAERVSVGEVKEHAVAEEANRLVFPPAHSNSVIPTPSPLPVTKVTPIEIEPVTKEKPIKGRKEAKKPAEPLPPVPAAPAGDQRPTQVLSVNRQFNFVVVNMGIQDRVKMGDTLRVEQGGKLIGRVTIEKLYENFSACTITEEISPHKIEEGDLVHLA